MSTRRRRLTVEDLWAMERLSDPALAPDGRRVAFVVTTFSYDDNEGSGRVWVVDVDGSDPPRRVTSGPSSAAAPAWSPDGRTIVYAAKHEDDPAQLWRVDPDGGEPEQLTRLPIAVSDPKWFPDGQRIAFAAWTFPDLGDDFDAVAARLEEHESDETQARITDHRLLRFWDEYRTDGRLPHVFVLDLESGTVTDAMPGIDKLMALRTWEWDLSPEGDEIAFIANATDPPWKDIDFGVWTLALETGELRHVSADNPGWDGSPVYTPDGRYLLYGRSDRIYIGPDFTHLARLDRATGEHVVLAADWDGEPQNWRVTPDGETIVFEASWRGYKHLFAIGIDGGEPRVVGPGGYAHDALPTGDHRVVYLRQDLHHPDDLYVAGLDAGEPRQITHFNIERLVDIDLGTIDDVTIEGAEGDPLQMFVLYPPGFDPERKWPLLVILHGGPHSASFDDFHYRWNSALFAARGYVVVTPNFHGSKGFGQAYAESILGDHASKPFADVMAATDHILASGVIDEERMAALGASYGGYLVSWVMGSTDRFAAIVNHAGVYDLTNQYASDYPWTRGAAYGSVPWEDPERILLASPSRNAMHFDTPTLILHGERDYRVPVTQGINLYNVLGGKGVPARIVIFPNENHWVLKPQAAAIWWREVDDWLEKWVGSGPTATTT